MVEAGDDDVDCLTEPLEGYMNASFAKVLCFLRARMRLLSVNSYIRSSNAKTFSQNADRYTGFELQV